MFSNFTIKGLNMNNTSFTFNGLYSIQSMRKVITGKDTEKCNFYGILPKELGQVIKILKKNVKSYRPFIDIVTCKN